MKPTTHRTATIGDGRSDHDHHFGQAVPRLGEARTRAVVTLTAVMMLIEIAAGVIYGSMALLADGLHMASHASALGLSLAAYIYARRHAHDRRFSFGTGKINSLAGFASAVVLALFALTMAGESIHRFLEPVPISFDQAIAVAILGLVVNVLSVVILRDGHDHHHHGHQHDHNLQAAHLHVLADALTSLLAIIALVAAKITGAVWMDPAMGLVGGALVAFWSWGLMKTTGSVLLDRQAEDHVVERLRRSVEGDSRFEIVDLHVWSIGPGYRAAIISVRSPRPDVRDRIAELVPSDLGIAHLSVEILADAARVSPRTSNRV